MKKLCLIVITLILTTLSICLNADSAQLSKADSPIRYAASLSKNYIEDVVLYNETKEDLNEDILDNNISEDNIQYIESMKIFDELLNETIEENDYNIQEETQQKDIIKEQVDDTQPDTTYTQITYGTAGRLYINDFDVAVYDDGASGSQATVDAYDSATLYRYHGTTVIADHWNQGFEIIKDINIGDTCYIEQLDGSHKRLICVGKEIGTNLRYALLDANGTTVYGNHNYVMYTCNEDWQHVTLVYWESLDD